MELFHLGLALWTESHWGGDEECLVFQGFAPIGVFNVRELYCLLRSTHSMEEFSSSNQDEAEPLRKLQARAVIKNDSGKEPGDFTGNGFLPDVNAPLQGR